MALLLVITCVSGVQMGHASPFQTFMFQELSNDVRNISIQWVLTLTIALWKLGNQLGLQLPKWEFTWECEGSFPHILLHSWKHEMWLLSSVLAHTFANPCFGRESKVKVATMEMSHDGPYKSSQYQNLIVIRINSLMPVKLQGLPCLYTLINEALNLKPWLRMKATCLCRVYFLFFSNNGDFFF
jgi:hypothetical protein